MGNWFRSRKSSTAPRKQISYRPRLEGLEDRNLMSVTIDPILDKSVAVGQSLVVPFTATDTDGNALTYTITSNNPSVTTKLHTGNTFMTVTVAGFGDMTFELFNDETPMTVAKITALIVGTINTNKPFYDGLTFHRVVPDFVIQGGDPKGDGTGGFNGTGYPFADEFKSDLIYTGDGQLGMANSGPSPPAQTPTNNSQFFVTIGNQTHLNNQNTIFGQLLRGFAVRDAISKVAVVNTVSNKPVTPPVITMVRIVQDLTDGVVTLNPAAGFVGSTEITVTADNGKGVKTSKTFQTFVGTVTHTDYVKTLYQGLLGRAADSGGLSGWAGALDQGKMTRDQVVQQISDSFEGQIKRLNDIYQSLLNRAIDTGAKQTFQPFIASGHQLWEVKGFVAGSTEYLQNRAHNSYTEFVTDVYQDFLGRAPEASVLNTDADYLSHGGNRANFVFGILRSQEGEQTLVKSAFNKILHRDPEAQALNDFTAALQAGLREEMMIVILASSIEHFVRE